MEPPQKRNSEATRARILAAAKQAFSNTGYSHTGIREIAAVAGTSSTLVLRYYGSKLGLFEAALRDAMPTDGSIRLRLDEFARELADVPGKTSDAADPMLMIAMASGEREAAELAAQVFTELNIVPIGDHLGEPDGKVRALEMAILAIGFTFFMKHLPLAIFDERERASICDWFTRLVNEVIEPERRTR
ncbi:TetR/AcrR family transcriptional regulator [Novosphingobium malaysiense]|uniref:TetR/AcrR family transcriptional regulator n=1 Tax=Novosphingobium malaysiense TaxID=1348853 RepID=UPI00068B233A|nr:TetR/AcrR family transcriptional regulator [Novosphingobium malaysiense]